MRRTKINQVRYLALLLLLLPLLLACKAQEGTPLTSPLKSPIAEPLSPPTVDKPEADKATVAGQVVTLRNGQPVADIPVRLAEVYRQDDQGAFALDDAFSPGALTDSQGWFRIVNTEPKEYVIVVGSAISDYEIIQGKDGKARVWNAEPGKILDVGQLKVNLKP
jgi:hypothetical protein